jgi:hypothetical protein
MALHFLAGVADDSEIHLGQPENADAEIQKVQPPRAKYLRPPMATIASKTPAEIIDQIIDHLHSHPQALANWALVCRKFLPSSRLHAFETVRLHSTNSLTFCDLLESPHCTFVSFVRQLDLQEGRGRYESERMWFNKALPRLEALKSAPVEILSIAELRWDILSTESQASLLSTFQGIKHLSLSYSHFPTFNPLANLITSSPNLEVLVIDAVSSGALQPGTLCTNPLFDLQNLTVNAGPITTLLPWLLTSSPTPRLTHVEFGCVVDRKEARVIREFVANLGSSVTHLELGFEVLNSVEEQG